MILKEETLASILRKIEFPGEEKSRILSFLENSDIPSTVIEKILAKEHRKHRIKVWTIIAACAFGLLMVLGANRYISEFLFFLQSAVLLFISIALMAICLTGIIGVVMNIDKKRILGLLHHFRFHHPQEK